MTSGPLLNNGATYLATAGEGAVPQWHGTYTATVVNNNDPLGVGRLQLHVPQVLGNAVSGWAVPLGTYLTIPANGATISAAFIGGDPAQPAWSGSLDLAPSVNSGATKTSYSTSEPLDPKVGDIWVPITIFNGGETTGTPQVYTFDPDTDTFNWVQQPSAGPSAIQDGAITQALLGTDVTAIINSKSTTVANLSTSLPPKANVGDIWMQVDASGIITSIMVCTTAYTTGAGSQSDWTAESSMSARALGSPFVYQQSLTPNTANNGSNPPQVNDLWINTGSDNVIEQMTGGTSAAPVWSQFQIGSNAIANGTVKAGIVNGTTITGATLYLYNGTPGLGDMLLSISSAATTDTFGNPVQPGVYLYGPNNSYAALVDNGSDAALLLNPAGETHLTFTPQLFAVTVNAGGTAEGTLLVLTSGKENNHDDAAIQLFSASADNSQAAHAVIEFGGTVFCTVTKTGIILPGNATPAGTPGSMNLFADPKGALRVVDGNDGATYAAERKTLFTSTDSGAISSLTTIFGAQAMNTGSYRIHGQLFVTNSTTSDFQMFINVPVSYSGRVAYTVTRSGVFNQTKSGLVDTTIATSVGLGPAVSEPYVVTFDGFITANGASTMSLMVGTTAGNIVINAFSFMDIMPV